MQTLIPILTGLAAGGFSYWILSVTSGPPKHENLGVVESTRRQRLREASLTYRFGERFIQEFNQFIRGPKLRTKPDERIDPNSLWTKSDLASASVFLGAISGGIASFYGVYFYGPKGMLFLGAAAAGMTAFCLNLLVRGSNEKRLKLIKTRLPYVVDLMALVAETGGTLTHGITIAGQENEDNYLGHELTRVAREISLGVPEATALEGLLERYPDDDIRKLVFSILEGQKLGVPIAEILRQQSNEMIQTRIQWIEKQSAEAKIKIQGPGFFIALACIALMLAPFLLQLLVTQ
jgi:tight adherence protein C